MAVESGMATLNIKDPRVHALAHELAALRGTNATAAVRTALEEALVRARTSTLDRGKALRDLQARAAVTAADWPSDDDLYDDQGLPR